MKTREAIRPHDPDKAGLRRAIENFRKGINTIARTQPRLDIADNNFRRMPEELPGLRHTRFKRGPFLPVFQRIAGADHPEHAIKLEPLQRRFRHQHMPLMRRIERSAEQADA